MGKTREGKPTRGEDSVTFLFLKGRGRKSPNCPLYPGDGRKSGWMTGTVGIEAAQVGG